MTPNRHPQPGRAVSPLTAAASERDASNARPPAPKGLGALPPPAAPSPHSIPDPAGRDARGYVNSPSVAASPWSASDTTPSGRAVSPLTAATGERETAHARPAAPKGLGALPPGTAATFSPQERDALLVLAYVHLEQARPEEAATLLRPLYRTIPDDAEVERCLALAELSAGRPEAAARLAAHAYVQAPAGSRSALGLIYARALWLGGDAPAAREVLAKLLAVPASTR